MTRSTTYERRKHIVPVIPATHWLSRVYPAPCPMIAGIGSDKVKWKTMDGWTDGWTAFLIASKQSPID